MDPLAGHFRDLAIAWAALLSMGVIGSLSSVLLGRCTGIVPFSAPWSRRTALRRADFSGPRTDGRVSGGVCLPRVNYNDNARPCAETRCLLLLCR